MFALRRIAVRAIQFQPARQLSTLRPVSSNLPLQKPALYRSFHNCRRWLAEDDLNKESPAEAQGGETVTAEPETQAGIKEESVAASDVIDAKSSTTSSSAAETAKDALSSAAETVQNAASSAAATAQSHFSSSNGLRSQSPPSKILYVGNLFFEVTSANLEAEFARYGEVTNSRVVSDNRGMSKGFGYIEFASQESADKAVRELDQKVFQGRRMAVQYHVRRDPRRTREHNNKSIPPSKTLFIGNMSYQMSDRDLNDLFREIKNVLDVRVAIDRRTGQPRGFAHADFMDIASAEIAKESLANKVVYGRQLRVDFSGSSSSQKSA